MKTLFTKHFGKRRKRRTILAFSCITALAAACSVSQEIRAYFTPPEIFIAKPYVQLGQGKIEADKVSHDILFLARRVSGAERRSGKRCFSFADRRARSWTWMPLPSRQSVQFWHVQIRQNQIG